MNCPKCGSIANKLIDYDAYTCLDADCDVSIFSIWQQAEIDRLNQELERYKKKCEVITNLVHSVEDSRPLCPDHRDKQRGKTCLACRIEELERDKPKWQSGKPPDDGWYWSRNKDNPTDTSIRYFDIGWISETTWQWRQWIGPLPEPTE